MNPPPPTAIEQDYGGEELDSEEEYDGDDEDEELVGRTAGVQPGNNRNKPAELPSRNRNNLDEDDEEFDTILDNNNNNRIDSNGEKSSFPSHPIGLIEFSCAAGVDLEDDEEEEEDDPEYDDYDDGNGRSKRQHKHKAASAKKAHAKRSDKQANKKAHHKSS